jgi:tripartite-type tricarboxylate transporter receptor subunit TctC
MKFFRTAFLAAAAVIAAAATASAQTYPTQMVRMIVPFSAGSATDILARILTDDLSKRLGQQVVVENRPGLAGTVAVAQAPADGYTLMLTSNGHTIAKIVNKALPYDPVKDFAGVTKVASVPLALIVPPNQGINSLQDLIKQAKAKPGSLNFASPGLGSSTFIAAAMFNDEAKINMVHVPYKGSPECITSVIRGDSQMYFTPVNVGADLISSGQVKAIAVATPERIAALKDVPTISEAGVSGFSYDSWFGIMVRSGTPKPIIDRLNAELVKILAQPEIKEKLVQQGAVPSSNTPAEFDAMIKGDTERLTKIFAEATPK